jgi:hypothetical protein
MKIWSAILLVIGLATGSLCANARTPVPTAVFNFGLDDTSLQGQEQGPQVAQQQRLTALDAQLREALSSSGCCKLVDMNTVADQGQGVTMWHCNGCDVDLAQKLGAKLSVTGWVQKVSNLILNINLSVRDVDTGKVISAGSVDIRGNTDQSWSRGLTYLLQDRLHPAQW